MPRKASPPSPSRKKAAKTAFAGVKTVAPTIDPPLPAPSDSVELVPIVSPVPTKKQKLIRSGAASGQPGQSITFSNRWRENYNPFRNFAIRKAVEWLESGQRGDYAMLQWTYRKLERSYPTLSALITRCEAPVLNYRWEIKTLSELNTASDDTAPTSAPKRTLPPGWTKEQAQAQQVALQEAYNGIDNLKEAIRHMHMAEFREYAHCQKHRTADGEIYHLECLDQWLMCRDGLYGNWFWNPDSIFTTSPLTSLGVDRMIGGDTLPAEDFIIRQVPRPINEVAIIAFTRWSLCNKNWDAFIEIYGVPSGVVEMPANVPPDKEGAFEQAARQISEGGTGAMPNGSKYYPNDSPRGVDPFTPRIRQLDEDLVMCATGGKMSMLNAKEGFGGGNQGKTQEEIFQEIAEARSQDISEVFQNEIDREILQRDFPGQPALAYFELAPRGDIDVDVLVGNVGKLAVAGYKTDPAWLQSETGYPMTYEPYEKEDIRVNDAVTGTPTDAAKVDKTIGNRLKRLALCPPERFQEELRILNKDFPSLRKLLGI